VDHAADEYEPDGDDSADDDADDEPGVELHLDAVDDPVAHLLRGEVSIEGRMPNSSNATMLAHVTHEGATHAAIYKPLRGERPLWDFEPGLHRREVAMYRLSESLGLGVIPPTVLRDGPLGEGSFQWFVAADHRHHYFTILEEFPDTHEQLRDMAALDVLANNTDRKSGHVLVIPDDGGAGDEAASSTIWGIDNGLCFSAEFKLRTVIWDFADEALPDHVLEGANRLLSAVPLDVAALLSDDEVEAIRRRAAWMVKERRFPDDPTGRRWPWPLV